MEIKFEPNIKAANSRPDAVVKAQPAATATDSARFEGSTTLDQALRGTPASRAEALARARDVIGDVAYPPREMIQRISALLALHVRTDDTQAPASEPGASGS